MRQRLPQLQHHPQLQPSTSIAKVRWRLLRAPSAAMGGGGLLTSSMMFLVLCLPTTLSSFASLRRNVRQERHRRWRRRRSRETVPSAFVALTEMSRT